MLDHYTTGLSWLAAYSNVKKDSQENRVSFFATGLFQWISDGRLTRWSPPYFAETGMRCPCPRFFVTKSSSLACLFAISSLTRERVLVSLTLLRR